MLIFNKNYFSLTVVSFILEVIIVIFINDHFIRPYFGDFLIVILLYCFLKSFINLSIIKAALSVLSLSFLIEFLQYIKLLEWFGLGNSKSAQLILGSHFSWIDIFAYTTGIMFVIFSEIQLNFAKRKYEISYLRNKRKSFYQVN